MMNVRDNELLAREIERRQAAETQVAVSQRIIQNGAKNIATIENKDALIEALKHRINKFETNEAILEAQDIVRPMIPFPASIRQS